MKLIPASFTVPAIMLAGILAGTVRAADQPPIESVTIGPNREFLVNGKPFLPIFGWMQKPETLPVLKEMGFNTISGYWRDANGVGDLTTADKFGEAALAAGLYFIPPFEGKHADEMARIKGAPYLLSWFQKDEPDLIKKSSDAEITHSTLKINRARPLLFLADGNPKTSAVLSPMAGSEITIRYPKPVTVKKLSLGNGPDGLKASEIAVLVGGKEICRGPLPNSVAMTPFDLAAPVTMQELTLKIIATHPASSAQPESTWGTFAGVDGFDANEANLLKCEIRKGPQQSPEETHANFVELKSFDSSKPVLLTFASFFLEDFYDKSWYTTADAKTLYPKYVGAADVYGIDIYPIFGWNQPENIRWVAKSTTQLRDLVGPRKPVFQWIETCNGPFGDNAKPVTGLEIRNEVYQALAKGCTAIGYFTHIIKPKLIPFGVPPENQEAIKKINAEISALSATLLAADAAQQPTLVIDGDLLSLCHAKTDGQKTLTIIALNMDGKYRGGTGTISLHGLKEGTEITVYGENRSIQSGAGQWKDTFDPLAVHVYQLKL